MTDVLPSDAPMPRAVLGWDGTRWRVMAVDGSGHVQVDVLGSALPAGAATSANQAIMITALQLIDDLVGALGSVNTDDLQVDVKTSALPAGAATAANQTTMITALQLIDDLRNALDSVGTDELDVNVEASVLPTGAATSANQALMIALLEALEALGDASQGIGEGRLVVRGEDQLFSFEDKLLDHTENLDTGAGPIGLAGTTVPEGKIWVVTSVLAINTVTVCSSIYLYVIDWPDEAAFRRGDNPSITEGLSWSGHLYLEEGDRVNATFVGCALHDLVYLQTLGYQMTLETGAGPGWPPYFPENFEACDKVDPNGDITVTDTRCDVDTMRIDALCYVSCDYGVDHFGDFEHLVTAHLIDDYDNGRGGFWGLSQGHHCIRHKRGADEGLTVYWERDGIDHLMCLEDCEVDNLDTHLVSVGVTYYCTIKRLGTVLTCKVYSDEARTHLLFTNTVTCGTMLYRYLEPVQGHDIDAGSWPQFVSFWCDDFNLQE